MNLFQRSYLHFGLSGATNTLKLADLLWFRNPEPVLCGKAHKLCPKVRYTQMKSETAKTTTRMTR